MLDLGPRQKRPRYPWVCLPAGIAPLRSQLPVTPVVLPSGTPALLGSQSQSSSQPDFLSLPSFQPNGPGRLFGEQRVYPTEVEVNIENSQVAERPLDVSMEEDLGSEEQVLSINSLPPPPLGDGIETICLFP